MARVDFQTCERAIQLLQEPVDSLDKLANQWHEAACSAEGPSEGVLFLTDLKERAQELKEYAAAVKQVYDELVATYNREKAKAQEAGEARCR